MFPELREAVTRLLYPESIRWISLCHFESDDCGTLNHWPETAPKAEAACSVVGALVSVTRLPACMTATFERSVAF